VRELGASQVGQVLKLFLFAMWTGLRTREPVALRSCDVSPEGRRIGVRLSLADRWVFHNPRIKDWWQNSQPIRVHRIRALTSKNRRRC
jgi:hypothetical protein